MDVTALFIPTVLNKDIYYGAQGIMQTFIG